MRDRLRPLLAAALALVLPGLGHLLVRRWRRALAWHVLIVGGTVALYGLYDVEPIDPIAEPTVFVETIPPEVSIPVSVLVALSAIDAYHVGREAVAARIRSEAATRVLREHADGADGTPPVVAASGDISAGECPNCGRETDPELDFCHWCTEPLPWGDEE